MNDLGLCDCWASIHQILVHIYVLEGLHDIMVQQCQNFRFLNQFLMGFEFYFERGDKQDLILFLCR